MNAHENFGLSGKNDELKEEIKKIEEKAMDKYGPYSDLADLIVDIDEEIKLVLFSINKKRERIQEIDEEIYNNHVNNMDTNFSSIEEKELQLEKIQLEKEIADIQTKMIKLFSRKTSLIQTN